LHGPAGPAGQAPGLRDRLGRREGECMTPAGLTQGGPAFPAPPALDDALANAAEGCCGALPADGEWSGSIADGNAPAVPGPGAQAVAATLPGLGRLVLAVTAAMAREVQVGPAPADYAVVDVAALAPVAGEQAHGLLLLDNDVHKATLAFLAPAAAPAPVEV